MYLFYAKPFCMKLLYDNLYITLPFLGYACVVSLKQELECIQVQYIIYYRIAGILDETFNLTIQHVQPACEAQKHSYSATVSDIVNTPMQVNRPSKITDDFYTQSVARLVYLEIHDPNSSCEQQIQPSVGRPFSGEGAL